jgi:tetratricopeptide (TPR) repeat protein
LRFPFPVLAAFAWLALLFSQCDAQQPAAPAGHVADIAEIQSLIRSKQYDRALALTSAGLKSAPADYRLWTIQGIALSLKGDTTQAVTSFDRAIRISPSYAPALKGEVQILFQSGDKRAVPVLEKILKADPGDATAHEMLANLERKEGNCAAANEHFARAADALNAHPESLEAYGYCLFETKQPEKAVPVFERLAALLPDRGYARYDLAVVQVAGKQYDAAIATLEPLLTADQKDADVFSLASQAYEKVKNTPKAVELLRQAIVLSPTTPGYYAAFADLCLEHDSFQTGVDMMSVGLRNIPDDPSLYLSRGLLYVELADFEKAEADFKRVEKLSSFQALGSYALDLTAVQKNNPEQALARVRSQLHDHPDDPLLNYFLAQSLMNQSPDVRSEAYREAMRAALTAVKIRPDYVPVHDLLASMYLHANQYEQAIEECHTALRYDPSDEGATYHLLIALKHTGQTEELAGLSKRLAQLHRESLQHENERKSFRLIEADKASNPKRAGANAAVP